MPDAGGWRFYDVDADPGEHDDLASTRPEILQALIARWDIYARETALVLPDCSPAPTR